MADAFAGTVYTIRQKVFTFLSQKFHVFDASGAVVLFCNQKAFKLREDLRLYSGEDMKNEVMSIKTPQILDISAVYHVTDSRTGAKIGSLQRKGLKSLLRDEWLVLNGNGKEIAKIVEDSTGLAIARRLIGDIASLIMPQSFHLESNGHTFCRFHQNRNPFVKRLTIDFSGDPNNALDKRLGIAAGILLAAIEGRQKG